MNKKIQEAVSFGKKRNYEKAVEILLDVIKEEDIPEAYLYLGRSYYALGHYALSIRYLRMFLDKEPDSAIGHFFMGRSYMVSGLVKNAVLHLKLSLKFYPESAHARGFLGLALMKLRRFESALKYLGEAVEISPENRRVFEIYLNCLLISAIRKFNLGELSLARDMFVFYTGYIEDKVIPYVYLGMLERQLGNLEEAMDYYNKALALSPHDELLLLRRALLLYQTGYKAEAESELRKLNIEGYKDISDIENQKEERFLSIKYFNQKDYKEAVFFGREALKKHSKDLDMHLIMAESYRMMNQFQFAKNHYLRAFEIDRSRIEIHYGYILLLWQIEEFEEMLKELQKLEQINPDDSISDYYTALVYCKLGYDSSVTIKALQDQIRLNPKDPFLFRFLGEEYLKAGLESLAEKWFVNAEKLLGSTYELLADFIEIYRKTGENNKLLKAYDNFFSAGYFDIRMLKDYILLLYSKKKYKRVIRESERALAFTKSIKITRILANSYRLTGDFNNAVILYRSLLRDDPANTTYLKALLYCKEKNGEIDKSIELLESALRYRKKPESSLYLILGVLLFRSGNLEKAAAVFRENISKFPHDWRSYKNLGMLYKEQGLDEFAERFLKEAEKRKK